MQLRYVGPFVGLRWLLLGARQPARMLKSTICHPPFSFQRRHGLAREP
jgi:hypothetical protein